MADRAGFEGIQNGGLVRTVEQMQADAEEARRFWKRAEHPKPDWLQRVQQDGDPIVLALREAAAWNAQYSAADTANRRRNLAARQTEQERLRRDDSQLRAELRTGARLLPPPQLHHRRRLEVAADRKADSAWRARVGNPSPTLVKRVLAERDAPTVAADWAQALTERGSVSDLEQLRDRRLRNLQRATYRSGRISPVGMSLARALEIAVAALSRSEALGAEIDRGQAVGF